MSVSKALVSSPLDGFDRQVLVKAHGHQLQRPSPDRRRDLVRMQQPQRSHRHRPGEHPPSRGTAATPRFLHGAKSTEASAPPRAIDWTRASTIGRGGALIELRARADLLQHERGMITVKSRRLSVASVPEGTVIRAGKLAVGNSAGRYFAVSRRCRHMRANLAAGSIDADGCLVCPWHGAKYAPDTGLMTLGPQGIFAKIPGTGARFKLLTRIFPLRRRRVSRIGDLLVIGSGTQ